MLADHKLVKDVIAAIAEQYTNQKIDAIAAVEARGFIFGAILAQELQCAFVPMRKSGKLPYKTVSREYALEYGTASVEVHEDAIEKGWNVLVHDDLLATGGTASAAGGLIQQLGGRVAGFSFLINLAFLPGEQKLVQEFNVQPKYILRY